MASRNFAFTAEYREKCFMAWVGAGCPPFMNQYMYIFPVDDKGRKPSKETLNKWLAEYGWRERAENIQAKAIEKVNEEVISLKADLLRRQFEDSVVIATKAKEYLATEGFDSAASAVNAYFNATKEQRLAVGISEIIEKMTKMTDAELEKEILTRIKRASDAGQIIDGEINDENQDDSEE